jgi:outer membrane protein W
MHKTLRIQFMFFDKIVFKYISFIFIKHECEKNNIYILFILSVNP